MIIKKLKIQDCIPALLSRFNRYQEVKRCWRKEDGEWLLKDISFIDQWSDEEKAKKTAGLSYCLQKGGVVLGAFIENDLIGFASIANLIFGSNREYIQLEMLHVSFELRGKGIGKALFREICREAKKFDAKKLYISAQSSEETQAFYRLMGCVEAVEINNKLYEEEPFDCHLEYGL